MNVAGFVGMTDDELIVQAMRNAQSLLAEHIERGPFDAEEALTQLLEILDRPDVVAATDRLCREYGLRPRTQGWQQRRELRTGRRRRCGVAICLGLISGSRSA
jgi:hypothetical protein